MIRIIRRLHYRIIRFTIGLVAVVALSALAVGWCRGYRIALQPVSYWSGQRDLRLRTSYAAWLPSLELRSENWTDSIATSDDVSTCPFIRRAVVADKYLFVPETFSVGVYPTIFGGVGGTCPNLDPLEGLQRVDRFPKLTQAYRIGIFWIAKPNTLRLLTFSDTERDAYREAVYKYVCQ